MTRARKSPIGSRRALVVNPSGDLYGSDRMMLETVRGLTETGWDVTVALGDPGPLQGELASSGATVRVVLVPVARKSNLSPSGVVRLAGDHVRLTRGMHAVIQASRPDVLYVNTVTVPWWLALARAARVPAAVHVHEAEATVPGFVRAGLSAPLLSANTVIYNSRTSRRVAASSPGIGRHLAAGHVVYNAIPSPAFATPASDFLDGQVRLLYVGRVSPRKGVDVAVSATALLRDSGLRVHLDIVGDVFRGYEWYDRQLKEQVSRARLEDSVTWHGFVGDVAALRSATDIALVPSRGEESFGNVIVESVLSRRPVVFSDHYGLQEAAAGLQSVMPVAPDDPAALAGGVRQIVREWSRRRLLAELDAGVAVTLYATERYRRDVVAILDGIASRGQAAGRRVT